MVREALLDLLSEAGTRSREILGEELTCEGEAENGGKIEPIRT